MTAENTKEGYVYILTNPSMPEWIKIGSAVDVDERLNDLNRKTAVPLSFACFAKVKCPDCEGFEHQIQGLIDTIAPELRAREIDDKGRTRIREFYRMSAPRALNIVRKAMKMVNISEDELFISKPTDEEIEEAAIVKKTFNTTFKFLDIPKGTKLVFLGKKKAYCETTDDKNLVNYEGQVSTISHLAAQLLERTSGSANGFDWFALESDTDSSLYDLRVEKEKRMSEDMD